MFDAYSPSDAFQSSKKEFLVLVLGDHDNDHALHLRLSGGCFALGDARSSVEDLE